MQSQVRIPELMIECIEQGLKLHDLERELIIVALEKYQDKRSVAANKLGIPVYTLYKKIKKLQIKKFNSFPVIKKDVSLSAAKRLGLMIAQARKKKEIGQKELAYLLGYKGVSSVCHIEYGRRLIPIRIVNRVSSLLGIPIPVLNQAIYEVEMEKDKIA